MARKKPLPYAVVTQAVKGDPEAMDRVLTHYRGFIRWLAKRDYMDRDNVSKSYVDEYPCTSTVIKTTSKKLKTKGNVWKYERSDTAPFFCRGIPGTLPVPVFCLFSPPFKACGKLHSTLPHPLNSYRYTAASPGLCVNPKGFPQSFLSVLFLKK